MASRSGVEAVVVIIHIAVSFLRRFNRRVGKCCDKVSEQDNFNKVFHLNSYEKFWERTWSYNGTEKCREKNDAKPSAEPCYSVVKYFEVILSLFRVCA